MKLRRGIQTIEVQAPIVAAIGTWLLSAAQVIPPRWGVYVTMLALGCISVARGLAKLGDPRLNVQNITQLLSKTAGEQTMAASHETVPAGK